MAVPNYASDLTPINDGSAGTGTTTTPSVFVEPASAVLGTLSGADADNFIQGTTCCTKTTGASGAPALAGIGYNMAAAQTITSPNAFYCWVFVGGGGLIDTYANGGIRLHIGNDYANYRYWYVDGNDYFPYIGWQCIAIETDNAVVAATGSVGTPSAVKQHFGAIFNCKINIGKGNPMGVDSLRWGRTITVTLGALADGYATFPGIAATNDTNTNRWGQFQAIPGGYQLQGKLLLGVTGGDAVDFRDSNRSIAIALSRKTAASFNAIEIQNASSRVDWDSCNFTALGTNSRGTVTVTDNADVNITGCSFTGMDTFSFLAATDCLSSIFRGCNAITTPGSNLSGTSVLTSTVAADTGALSWTAANTIDTDGKLDNMTFSKGTNAHHAIQFGTTTKQNITLRGITFTGFDTTDGSTSANDAVLYFPDTGGDVTWTVNLIGCSGTISYKKARAGDTVDRVQNPVTLTVHVQDAATGVAIQGARVYVLAGAGGPLSEGTLIINDLTGTAPYSDVTDTRTWASDQPITGWVRKASGSPYYKTGSIAGTIDSTSGLGVTIQMVLDE